MQKKLGSNEEDKGEAEVSEEPTEPEKEESPGVSLIKQASDEYYANGNKLSEETMAKFSEMSSADLLQAYIEINANNPQQAEEAQAADITEAQISDIKKSAGGEQAYANVVNWAKDNLEKSQVNAFDEVVNTGSVEAIKLAVAGLKAQYDNANGVEGRMVTGKAPTNSGDIYRSQAELVAAMNDPRYDRDPAYRQDVIEKLDRSNLEF